jgi:hypothetical protein
MESSSGQKLAVKFCFKAGKSATEIVEMVRAVYGDEALTQCNIFRWCERFREGREDVQDDPRVVASLSLERTATLKRFGRRCCKIVTPHFG